MSAVATRAVDVRKVLRSWYFSAKFERDRYRHSHRRPCVVIFPSDDPWSASSNLRAWLVAPELERLGWRALVVPAALSLKQRRRILRVERPDVVFIQQMRHPLNQPALYSPYPCVLDDDGADYLDPRHHELIVRCARDAAAVVGGSRFVAECLGRHNSNLHVVWTCTPRTLGEPSEPPEERDLIVTWAHATPFAGYPHEARLIQAVMIEVCRRIPCTFWLFGTAEEEAREWFEPIRAVGGRCVAHPTMSYEAYLSKVAEAAVGLQPVASDNEFSRGKSFGKLLAYLAGQVAVVASDAVDHPLFFQHGRNGYLAAESVDSWALAITTLLSNKQHRCDVARAGWQDFQMRLTMDVFAVRLDRILRTAMAQPARV